MKQFRTAAAGVFAAVLFGSVGLAAAADQGHIRISEKSPFGKYLSDDQGRAIYMFTADTKGKSACYGACAQAWPPVKTDGKPEAESGVNAALLGTVKRQDGTIQATYDGMPLYYFVQDQGPGSTKGEEIKHFGGSWYLVSPEGKKIEAD